MNEGGSFPCGKPRSSKKTPKKPAPTKAEQLLGPPVDVTPVTDIHTPEDLLLKCMPAFGGAYVRRIYKILDQAIGQGVPLIISVAGPITVSNQHRAWLIPLLEAGWAAYITVTDAICYHDGHDSLRAFNERPIREAAIEGRDEEYGKAGVIRVTDTGFDEDILYQQDRFFTAMLRRPEFQKKMTGTEFRYLLGAYYGAQEEAHGIKPGLLSTCNRMGIPVFVGAPGDGSAFLNSVKLWALAKLGRLEHKFEIDVHAEVFESCAYHYWGLTASKAKKLAVLILGGGVSKNFSLQPEPTLSQIFQIPGIRGYDFDVQIVGAPVTDGSLTGCKGQEAHTWGKVSAEALASTVESYHADYSTIMPLIAWALIEKRKRFTRIYAQRGPEMFKYHPEARGYLGQHGTWRLYPEREKLVAALFKKIGSKASLERLEKSMDFPLQLLEKASQ